MAMDNQENTPLLQQDRGLGQQATEEATVDVAPESVAATDTPTDTSTTGLPPEVQNKVVAEYHKQSFEEHNRQACYSRACAFPKSRLCGFGGDDTVQPEGGSKKRKDVLSNVVEHRMPVEEVAKMYGTDPAKGLSPARAAEKLQEFGPNVLTPPAGTPLWQVIWHHLFANFQMLLWIGAILCFTANAIHPDKANFVLGVVLVIVVTLTGLFSWYQEHKSNAIMAQFASLLPVQSRVIRDGQQVEIPAAKLVPGDLIVLSSGDQIPADIRVTMVKNLKVDNSSLTGESDALRRSAEVGHDEAVESECLCFFGTLAVEGEGLGIVTRTGDNTFMGSIAQEAAAVEEKPTPIKLEIDHFVFVITAIALGIGFFFGVFGAVLGVDGITNVVNVIGIIVANVPEGLLATVTVVLTLTAKQMAMKMVLVKDLESVETLGSTTVIASDKTGTLTQNKMTLVNLFFAQKLQSGKSVAHSVKGSGGLPPLVEEQEEKDEQGSGATDPSSLTSVSLDDLKALQKVCILCNNAEFVQRQGTARGEESVRTGTSFSGSATEVALVRYFEQLQPGSINKLRADFPILASVPFNSKNKYQISIHINNEDSSRPAFRRDRLLVMKGAAEQILDRCSHVLQEGKPVELSEGAKTEIQDGLETMMSMGQRVLGCASLVLSPNKFPEGYAYNTTGTELDFNFPVKGLVFTGLVALQDPPRPDVPDAVDLCQKAGIRVVMVTGDHPTTATAIAREVNIIRGATRKDIAKARGIKPQEVDKNDPELTAVVVSGAELREMTEEELSEVLDFPEIVFARVSPQQKLRIVQALQAKRVFSAKAFRKSTDKDTDEVVVISKQVVAVTGDGVNDSPALKQADIGIAMGIVGTPVAREAANMILLDDNFSSIVKGVEEGRKIFDNLKKSIAYTLTSNIPEITPFLLFVSLEIPLALPTILILCIDLGTDMVPAIALAYEAKEADIMHKPPRDGLNDRLVTGRLISWSYLQIGLFQAVAGMVSFFYCLSTYGFPLSLVWGHAFEFDNKHAGPGGEKGYQYLTIDGAKVNFESCVFATPACHDPNEALATAQTAYFVSIILCQIATGLACKTKERSLFQQGLSSNWMLVFGIFTEVVLVLALVYVPLLHSLGTRALEPVHWLPPVPFALGILLYDEIRKLIIRYDKEKKGLVYRWTYY